MEIDQSFVPAAKLTADISAQSFKGLASLMHRLAFLRRQNACAGLKGKFLDSLINDFQKISFSDDPSKLFAGKVKSAMKRVAKHMPGEKTLQKARVSYRPGQRKTGVCCFQVLWGQWLWPGRGTWVFSQIPRWCKNEICLF